MLGIPPAPGFDLRSPSAILGRLGGWLLDRNADHSFPPRLNLRLWRPPHGSRRVLANASPQIRAPELLVFTFLVGAPGFELRSPPAILARLGDHLLDRFRGLHSPPHGSRRVLANASPQIRAPELLVFTF